MCDFMIIVAEGLYAIGLLAHKPSVKDVAATARRAFTEADDDESGQLTSAEFVLWGRGDEMVLQVIDRIEKAKRESTRKVDWRCPVATTCAS